MLLLHNFSGWDICNARPAIFEKLLHEISKFATEIQKLPHHMLCSTLTVDVVVFKKCLKKLL